MNFSIDSQHSIPRILVVDDNPHHRQLVRDILSPTGCDLTEAGDGQSAIGHLEHQEYDLVLLDRRMPDMLGDDLCRHIRDGLGLKLLPVIMVTGSTSRDDVIAGMAAGANDFIRKPYAPAELLARTQSFITQKHLIDQLDSIESLLYTLANMVEARDGETGDHCQRLAHNARIFGNLLGLERKDIVTLEKAAVLHDLGKLGIPDAVLLKKAKLDEAEWQIMRQHADIGADLLSGLRSMRDVVPVVRHHHERWDGSGYPLGLTGEEIPYLARVFQLVDICDALAYARPYKPAFPLEKVIAIFEEELERGWRDPILAKAFIELLTTQPEQLGLHFTSV